MGGGKTYSTILQERGQLSSGEVLNRADLENALERRTYSLSEQTVRLSAALAEMEYDLSSLSQQDVMVRMVERALVTGHLALELASMDVEWTDHLDSDHVEKHGMSDRESLTRLMRVRDGEPLTSEERGLIQQYLINTVYGQMMYEKRIVLRKRTEILKETLELAGPLAQMGSLLEDESGTWGPYRRTLQIFVEGMILSFPEEVMEEIQEWQTDWMMDALEPSGTYNKNKVLALRAPFVKWLHTKSPSVESTHGIDLSKSRGEPRRLAEREISNLAARALRTQNVGRIFWGFPDAIEAKEGDLPIWHNRMHSASILMGGSKIPSRRQPFSTIRPDWFRNALLGFDVLESNEPKNDPLVVRRRMKVKALLAYFQQTIGR